MLLQILILSPRETLSDSILFEAVKQLSKEKKMFWTCQQPAVWLSASLPDLKIGETVVVDLLS